MRAGSFLALLGIAVAACGAPASTHGDHDHGAAGAHADHGAAPASVVITHYTDASEVFVEFPPFAAGVRSPFALHLTELPSGKPIGGGKAVVRLAGPAGEERWEADASETPGIFRPQPIPQTAGPRRLFIDFVRPNGTLTHDLGEVTVYATAQEADASVPDGTGAKGVSFLKEQQWKVSFATAPAIMQEVRASVPARILIRGGPDGEAVVPAPASGRLEAVGAFPHVGQRVRAGDVLFRIRPLGSEAAAAASLAAERARAEAELTAAKSDLARIEGLLAQGAVSQRRVEEVRAQVAAADGAARAADAGLASLGGVVRAPISGTIADLPLRPGETAEAGRVVARLINADRLLIEARVPERDAGALRDPSGLVIEPPGAAPLTLIGETVRVLGSGGAIDPVSRTVPIAFEARAQDGLVIGMAAAGRVFVGETREAVTIPRSAVVDDGGIPVVFAVQDGEHFERRIVRLGAPMGDRVEVSEGVAAGERVVSTGAYLVRLAEAGPAEAGHGHAH